MLYIYNFRTDFNLLAKFFFHSAEAQTENHTEKMSHLLDIADMIPWVMAPAMVIFATIVISVLIAFIKLLEPALKAMIVAVMLAMSAWAVMMRAF